MIRLLILGWLTWCIPCTATIAEDAANVDDQSTHVQTRTIEIPEGKSTNRQVNAFCLNAKGQILAACGAGPGEILVMNDQGELLRSWEIAIKPEAIGSASDGTVLAGG